MNTLTIILIDTVNKKQAIKIIKESTNFHATIEYIQNSFTMNTKGDLMPEQDEQISLRLIDELVLNIKMEIKDLKIESNKRFLSLEQKFQNLDDKLNNVIELNNLKV